MITQYFRPVTIEEALKYLSQKNKSIVPLGGGTVLSKKTIQEDFEVVDLQKIGLDLFQISGNQLTLGAACTLQFLLGKQELQEDLRHAISRETNLHMRNMATIGGTIISADGCSPALTALSALDARLIWQPENVGILLGEWLPFRKSEKPGLLLEKIMLNSQLKLNIKLLARSPQDYPLASLAVAQWPGGRTRVVMGVQRDKYPVLVMDGTSPQGAFEAAEHTCKTILAGYKHEAYLTSVIPEMIKQMTQAAS